MKNLYVVALTLLFTACSSNSTSQTPATKNGFVVDGENGSASTKVVHKGMEHEFNFVDYDPSEQGLRFNAKIKNATKENKLFNIKDVILVIKSTKDGKAVEWKIPARDASLADKDLLTQIADLEKQKSREESGKSGELLVSNLGPKKNRDNELKSIKERREKLAEKSFYTTNLVPGEVITGLMYFSIEDDSFLNAPKTTMHLIVKGNKSNDIAFKFE